MLNYRIIQFKFLFNGMVFLLFSFARNLLLFFFLFKLTNKLLLGFVYYIFIRFQIIEVSWETLILLVNWIKVSKSISRLFLRIIIFIAPACNMSRRFIPKCHRSFSISNFDSHAIVRLIEKLLCWASLPLMSLLGITMQIKLHWLFVKIDAGVFAHTPLQSYTLRLFFILAEIILFLVTFRYFFVWTSFQVLECGLILLL